MLNFTGKINAVDIVNNIISYSAVNNVSDVHFDERKDHGEIRIRSDGVLITVYKYRKEIHENIIARLKILSFLRLDYHGMQDGRLNYKENLINELQIRISIIPAVFGESAVLRFFKDKSKIIDEIGFTIEQISTIKNCLHGRGLILINGTTGSGKTSTLYTLIKSLSIKELSIITLEDPVEQYIEGVRQIQIKEKVGITFSAGLRAILRQDPDVIMIGEIRDVETARIAMNSAMTGHLVLSTIHASSALGVIPRLIDMDIEPYLISNSLKLIISQKMVRLNCFNCLNLGCEKCNNNGFLGRRVVAEVLRITKRISSEIHAKSNIEVLSDIAETEGFIPIKKIIYEIYKKGDINDAELNRILKEE